MAGKGRKGILEESSTMFKNLDVREREVGQG